jgi:rhomboid family GlyGly-CTERM serine protease
MISLRPVLLFATPAILFWLLPATRGLLLYERAAIFDGAWWRLWTGHWMHFSASHLGWNLAVLLGAGAWLERWHPGWLLRYTLIAAPLISLLLLVGEPAMHTYGGLSGLATGVVVLLALARLARCGSGRSWWLGMLVLVAIKIASDATQATALFAGFNPQNVRPSALAHLGGAATAAAYLLSRPARSYTTMRRAIGAVNSGPDVPATATD